MFQLLYAIGFVGSLLSLILWFYIDKTRRWNRRMSLLFFTGFFLYLIGLVLSPGLTSYKLLILFRDGMIIGLIALFFNAIKHRYMIFYTMLLLLAGVVYCGFDDLQSTFQKNLSNQSTVPLDPAGEILVDPRQSQRQALQNYLKEEGLMFGPAFTVELEETTELDEYLIIDLPSERVAEIGELKKELRRKGFIDWFETNERIQIDPLTSAPVKQRETGDVPINDPLYHQQWHLQQIGYEGFLESPPTPLQKGVLAILDTGIDGAHEDLKENLNRNGRRDYQDKVGHGTHCAGIAGAVTGNSKGIASLNVEGQYFDLISVKVLNDRGVGSQHSIMQGMIDAADRGATVLSMSLGGRSNHKRQKGYEAALDYVNQRGAIVVAAAGNASSDASNYVPASVEGVICVSAIDSTHSIASFSNHVEQIDWSLSAPGTGILSTTPGDEYKYFNGTSMAAPLVASGVCIMKSLNPDMETEEAWSILDRYGSETKSGKKTGRTLRVDQLFKSAFPSSTQ